MRVVTVSLIENTSYLIIVHEITFLYGYKGRYQPIKTHNNN